VRFISSLTLAAIAVGCGKPKGQDDAANIPLPSASPASAAQAAAAGAAVDGTCQHLFEAPEGAELLCEEHVVANVAEIHWRSYGLTEARALVNQRYHAAAGGCRASLVFKPPLFSVAVGDQRLETYESSDTSFPRCSRAPRDSHRTVVIISLKHDRKAP